MPVKFLKIFQALVLRNFKFQMWFVTHSSKKWLKHTNNMKKEITPKNRRTKDMYHITIQQADKRSYSPSAAQIQKWAQSALKKYLKQKMVELTIRIVNSKEMTK